MNKRILALFLSVCMVVSMFSTLSITASAEDSPAAPDKVAELNTAYAADTVKVAEGATVEFTKALNTGDELPSFGELKPLSSLSSGYTSFDGEKKNERDLSKLIDGTTTAENANVVSLTISETGGERGTNYYKNVDNKYILITNSLKNLSKVSKIYLGVSAWGMGHYQIYVGNSSATLYNAENMVFEFKPHNLVGNDKIYNDFTDDIKSQIITLAEPTEAKYIGLKVLDGSYYPFDLKDITKAYDGTNPTSIASATLKSKTSTEEGEQFVYDHTTRNIHDYLRIFEFNAYGTSDAKVDGTVYTTGGHTAENLGITNDTVVLGEPEIVSYTRENSESPYRFEIRETWEDGIIWQVNPETKENEQVPAPKTGKLSDGICDRNGTPDFRAFSIKDKNTFDAEDAENGWSQGYTDLVYKLTDVDGTKVDVSDILLGLGGGNHTTTVFKVYIGKAGLTDLFNDSNVVYSYDEYYSKSYINTLHLTVDEDFGKDVTFVGVRVFRYVSADGSVGNGANLRWGEFNVYGTRQSTTDDTYHFEGFATGDQAKELPATFNDNDDVDASLINNKDIFNRLVINGTQVFDQVYEGLLTRKNENSLFTEIGGHNANVEGVTAEWTNKNFPDDESKYYSDFYLEFDAIAKVEKLTFLLNKRGVLGSAIDWVDATTASSCWAPSHLKFFFYANAEDAKAGENCIKVIELTDNEYAYLQLVLDTPIEAGCVVVRFISPLQKDKQIQYNATDYGYSIVYQRIDFLAAYGEYKTTVSDASTVVAEAENDAQPEPTVGEPVFDKNPDSNGNYPDGKVTITAGADNENYIFDGWYDKDGALLTNDRAYTIDIPAEETTYTAKYFDNIQRVDVSEISEIIFNGSEIEPEFTLTDGDTTLELDKDFTVVYENNTNVGKGAIVITGKGNYRGELTVEFDIDAKSISDAIVTGAVDATYTGSAIKPVVTVKVGDTTLALGTDYTVAYKNNTNKGTATVTVTGIGNYTGTKTATFKINAQSISKASVSGLSTKTYTGSAIKPTVTVKFGSKTLKNGTDYTVAYKNNTNAGTATVTITGKGNYSGSVAKTFKISAKKVTPTVSNYPSKTYNGKSQTQKLTVKVGKTTLKSSQYTVKYSSNKWVGKASVKVTLKGNYSGSKTVYFNINPKGTSVKSVAGGKKQITVKLNKQGTQTSGYQIQYSTSKSFKGAKTVTISSNKTTSKTIKSLKAKTKYYVRVRTYKTVGKTKYYSAWSSGKYATTKK